MELKRIFRGPLLLVLLAVLVITITLGWANSGSSYTQVDTGKIVTLIEQGQVKSAVLTDKNQTIQVTTKSGQQYEASFISGQGQALQQELQTQFQAGKLPGNYNVVIPKTSTLVSILETFIPYIIIALFFFFLLSQMQGGGSRVMNFGKSKAKLMTKDTPKTTFADVAGADEAIEELHEIKEFLQNPAKFQAIGAKIPKGVLLYGPPGTGKTLLARAVAGEAERAVLLDLRLRLRGDVRRRRRLPRPRPVRAGQGERPVDRVRRRDRRGRPAPGRGPRRRARRARADAQPDAGRARRLRHQGRRDRDRRHQPAGHPRPGAAAPGPVRPADRRGPARPDRPQGHPQGARARQADRRPTPTWTSSPGAPRASPARTWPT